MKQIKFLKPELVCLYPTIKTVLLATSLAVFAGCTKSGPSGSSSSSGPGGGGGSAALLTKEVIVGYNHLNVEVDSIVTTFQYDANNKLIQSQQMTTSKDSNNTFTSSLTYNYTYSGSLISSISGTFTQSATGTLSFNATTEINTTFSSSNGKVTGYVQVTSTTGSPFLPVTTITGNDSAVFAYDASGNLTAYNIYQKSPPTPGYQPLSMETLSFTSGNLTQTKTLEYVAGILFDTLTTVYQYNGKLSAAPFYIALGVPVGVINDLTQVTETQGGLNPRNDVSSYATTYNSANQPSNSVVTVTETPAYSGDLGTEKITFFYQ